MTLLGRAVKLPGRYLRSRGFGVHSPFAYAFITDVLAPRRIYGYYAYSAIGKLASVNAKIPLRVMRLWFRLISRFNALAPRFVGRGNDYAQKIAAMAVGNPPSGSDGYIWWVGGDEHIPANPDFWRPGNVYLLFRAPQTLNAIKGQMTSGMVFNSGDVAVIVRQSHLPRQDFDIIIK